MVKNKELAAKLREISTLLDEQKANPFRVNAYLNAAKTIETMPEPVEDLLRREGFRLYLISLESAKVSHDPLMNLL